MRSSLSLPSLLPLAVAVVAVVGAVSASPLRAEQENEHVAPGKQHSKLARINGK